MSAISPPDAIEVREARMRVGTLKYTSVTLAWTFLWLLWGDFCFTLMEAVFPSIVPLRLKQLSAPDWVLPVIMSTVPSIIGVFLNPTISTASDRYRSRFGRRIPFLMLATPFVAGSLVLMAFSPEIGAWLHLSFGQLGGWSIAGLAVFTVGLAMACFKIFEMFINTVFWYLFNDVVPQAFMGRFMGLFRVVGALCGILYNFYVFEHALTHLRYIFLGAATIYFTGFVMMCLFVKEGEYPPPDQVGGPDRGLFGRIVDRFVMYFRECLNHRIYWYFFLHSAFFAIAGAAGVWGDLLSLSLGVSMFQLKNLKTGIGTAFLLLSYPAGSLVDRIHPMRIIFFTEICWVLVTPIYLVWAYGHYETKNTYIILICLAALDVPFALLYWASIIPLMTRIFPRERFGQFCSFNALCATGFNVVGSLVVAGFMTRMRAIFPDALYGKDFCYRLTPLWKFPCLCIALFFLFLLFREWKKLGGEKSYTPPSLPKPQGFPVIMEQDQPGGAH